MGISGERPSLYGSHTEIPCDLGKCTQHWYGRTRENDKYVGHTSIEVQVTVDVEVLEQEAAPQRALSAYFTMVALDRSGRPMAVPPLQLETKAAEIAFEEGSKRHEMYHERKKIV